MTTYNTGNPIGSSDPRDLYDNAANIDEFATSTTKLTHPDRRGVSRKTMRGMETAFNSFLVNSGYQSMGDHAAGIEITAHNQVIRAESELWKVKASVSLPYTTTAVWATDAADFVSVGDAVLRQELGSGIRRVADIDALRLIVGRFDGDAAQPLGYWAPGDTDMPRYVWDAASTTADNGGSVIRPTAIDAADPGRWVWEWSGAANVKWFGVLTDNTGDQSSKVQAALDTNELVFMPANSAIRTTLPIYLRRGHKGIVGESSLFDDTSAGVGGSYFNFVGSTNSTCLIFESQTDNPTVPSIILRDFGIRVAAPNTRGIDFTQAIYSSFENIFIRLLESGGYAFYATGNGAGSAPYYNKFDGIAVFGNADPVTYPAQVGFYLQGDSSAFWANGANANTFSNIRHLVGLSYGVIMESGVGNVFNNIIFESISSYVFLIGSDVTASEGRASENIITNVWGEGTSTGRLARFEGLAAENSISQFSVNSMAPILYDDTTPAKNNVVSPKGVNEGIIFRGTGLVAGATNPIGYTAPDWAVNGFGGVTPSIKGFPVRMTVNTSNSSGAIVGTATVKLYRSGVVHPVLQITITEATKSGIVHNSSPDVTLSYNKFDKTLNSMAEVVVETSADWNQPDLAINCVIDFKG